MKYLRPQASSPFIALLSIVALIAVAYLLPNTRAQNQVIPATREKKPDFVPGELLVRFRQGTAAARNKSRASISVATATGRTVDVEVNHFGGSELVDGLRLARVAPEDAPAALRSLRARTDVAYAEPNFIRQADAVPNDPSYSLLWGLRNQGGGTAGISAETAWDRTTGDHNVVVGVIDSGIDIGHRDLKDNLFVNTAEVAGNNIDDDNNGFIDDVNGWDFVNHDRTVFDNADDDVHGTHVAGTIGAQGNNAIGVVGVNWDVQLLPLKAIGPFGTTDATLLEAYGYARAMRQRGVNLRVLNNSYGGQRFSQALLDGIKQLSDAGILFIASAGNESLNNDVISHFPASFDLPNVIAVAASTDFGSLAFFSNRGQQSVHLAAPGQGIVSTTPRGYAGPGRISNLTEPDGSTYSNFSGTSMAAPHVTGTAALALAANPSISMEKLRAALLFGVEVNNNFTQNVISGGRLNANKALDIALENDNTPPAVATNFRIHSQTDRRVDLRWNEAGDDGSTGRPSLDEIRFTDTVTGEQFRLFSIAPLDSGTERTVSVNIPLRHPVGQLSLRTFDNVGNPSTATVNAGVAPEVADPYIVTLGPPGTLTPLNSGTPIGPKGDDVASFHISLPFQFPFFGQNVNQVVVSSNGAIYVPRPPEGVSGIPAFGGNDFSFPTPPNLDNIPMIAGMWTDIRTDRNQTDNVYMVQLDLDRVVFRWQGVTFGAETPVNFEIELRSDGTIQTRYGAGNTNLQPIVVGISPGDPDAYLVDTYSSADTPISLTNAQSVTFALRNPPPPPMTDLEVKVSANPNPVFSGQNVTYTVNITNLGPSTAHELVMTDVLPAGLTFVSCTPNQSPTVTCTNSGQTVTGRLNKLEPAPFQVNFAFTIVATVTGAHGAVIQNTASATSFRPDPNPANNSGSIGVDVLVESFFTNAVSISAGNNHTTSVRNDGTVWTWGTGQLGQLGNGDSGIGIRALTPAKVDDLQGVTAVADGNGFVYALKSDGTVWGWGINSGGQLGDGTTFDRARPVRVGTLTNVTAIAAGAFYGAAVKTDGTVWIWGSTGGLGSTNFVVNTTPVQLTGIDSVKGISAGGNHLLMLKNDKTIWAAGDNSRGQLGDGTTTNRPSPVQVAGLTNVSQIAAGGSEFSLALKEDGTVWAWGIHFNGQLGPGGGNLNFDPHPNAIQVTGLPAGITAIAAGNEFCLALANDGTIWSWGSNSNFQLGRGTQFSQNPTPLQIPNFGNVSAVAAGAAHGVALKTDGSVWCWGNNFEGQLGDGSQITRLAPVRVLGLESVKTPVFDPPGGSFSNFVDVKITSPTPGAIIRYTTDIRDPNETDPVIPSGGTVRLTGFFQTLRARAWKPGSLPSGTRSGDFAVQPPLPKLVLDETSQTPNQIVIVNAALLLRDPLSTANPAPFFNTSNSVTYVTIFVKDLPVTPGQSPFAINIFLTASNGAVEIPFAVDYRPLPNTDLVQVTFPLSPNLPPGTCQLRLIVNGWPSNTGTFRIK
ncbi:MAG TPA: S8 family serine peptidase [Pyrinomonadaceae bacterium]|nr:S8 family serine peptidase [Pyrinomonadaceae bacterium]